MREGQKTARSHFTSLYFLRYGVDFLNTLSKSVKILCKYNSGCPTYLTLEMHGMAAFFQSKHRAFTYHISGEKVNGKNYWLSGDEQDAIWYGPHQVGTGYGSGLGRLHFVRYCGVLHCG